MDVQAKPSTPSKCRRWRALRAPALVALACASVAADPARVFAADFVSLCEVNQVYDTGNPTTDADRKICRCIEGKFDDKMREAAVTVFEKVLAARRLGRALHPSQVDLDEMIALMTFSEGLSACTGDAKAARAAY